MIKYLTLNSFEKDQLINLYKSVGWFAYCNNYDLLQKAVSKSLVTVSAFEHEQLLGLIRVVGDGVSIIYIQDLLVNPKYQRQGIGSELLKRVCIKYKSVRQKVLLTEEAPTVRNFYEKLGFTSCDQGNEVAFYREF
ncbi:GNAT family N-acetyltransferase [Xylocopilactobacillus apis]|uniref:N-acetyltransferase n=1 Tax=Xylocopilactobacillus apis TaxID=2932183 RepID=A0AAU9CY33_9LACO|nr:GNAT family N-acetyltransferase [Xylocopilactobacillus apis]BDR56319.1 N-acetyltransferase [Xylocopilactobacillus apis]